MNKIFQIALISLLLAGCATGYQPAGWSGGYKDMRLDEDIYLIEYHSNGFTSADQNYKHALHRAAELTKLNGYSYFQVEGAMDSTTVYTIPATATVDTDVSESCFGHIKIKSFQTSSQECHVIRPGLIITIRMMDYKTKNTFNADVILDNFNRS